MIYHDIEWEQAAAVDHYASQNWNSRYRLTWHGEDSYIARFDTTYDSENAGELDIDETDPRYDEFISVDFEILEIITDGPRRYNEYVSIDYRDFPDEIIDITNNHTVYPNPNVPPRP
ncbi:hypothetical protein [Trueperella bialowiezensis]|uniref:Uncharacterized protein n=1 Tax=Trueperella bialowiezensis TaxID=312285 RepID=A0A448PFW1_9ACTO|nr:hypothetical protein [Trueperella bialowiezensis]VEI13800.1 Uncharacterised protein [Trueperella bialowiezensis]